MHIERLLNLMGNALIFSFINIINDNFITTDFLYHNDIMQFFHKIQEVKK